MNHLVWFCPLGLIRRGNLGLLASSYSGPDRREKTDEQDWTTWHSPAISQSGPQQTIYNYSLRSSRYPPVSEMLSLQLLLVSVTPRLSLQSLIKVEELKPRCETRCHYNSLQQSHKTEQHSTSWPGTTAKSGQFTPNMFVEKFSASSLGYFKAI